MPFDIPDSDVSAVPATQSVWYSTDIDILAAGHSGTGVVSGCGVTAQGSPDMTVAVAAGVILAAGVQVAVTSGNLTIDTADGTNPRIDLISATSGGTKTYTAGTAAASPKPPALPAGHVGLAFVDVPATDTTIGAAQITDKRVVLALGGAVSNYITGDVTMTNADQFYDGPALTLAAGIYFLDGHVVLRVGGAQDITIKLWNGTTVKSSAAQTPRTNTDQATVHLSGIVVLAGSETWKISAASNGTTATIKATPVNNSTGATNTASYLNALKIA